MNEAMIQGDRSGFGFGMGRANQIEAPERAGDVHGSTNELVESMSLLEQAAERLFSRLRPVTLAMANDCKAGSNAPEPIRSDLATVLHSQAVRMRLLVSTIDQQTRDLQI